MCGTGHLHKLMVIMVATKSWATVSWGGFGLDIDLPKKDQPWGLQCHIWERIQQLWQEDCWAVGWESIQQNKLGLTEVPTCPGHPASREEDTQGLLLLSSGKLDLSPTGWSNTASPVSVASVQDSVIYTRSADGYFLIFHEWHFTSNSLNPDGETNYVFFFFYSLHNYFVCLNLLLSISMWNPEF